MNKITPTQTYATTSVAFQRRVVGAVCPGTGMEGGYIMCRDFKNSNKTD